MDNNSKFIKTNVSVGLWLYNLILLHFLTLLSVIKGFILLGVFPSLASSFYILYRWINNGEYDLSLIHEFNTYYKKCFKKANQLGWSMTGIGLLLVVEKLLDPETFSQSTEQKQAKGQNNQIGVFQDWLSYFTTGRSEKEAINDPMFGPLTSEFQEEPLMPIDTGIKRGSFAITSANPSPEASLRWVDYFYSPEGYEYLNHGPEGYLWKWEDEEGGTKVYNEEVDPDSREDYRGTITPAYGITVPGLSVELDPIGGERTEFSDFLVEETEEKIKQHGEVIFPQVYLTTEEQDEVNSIQVDLETYVVESEAAFITGNTEINDENWDNYISTLESIGVRRLEEIHQDAYNRWLESGE